MILNVLAILLRISFYLNLNNNSITNGSISNKCISQFHKDIDRKDQLVLSFDLRLLKEFLIGVSKDSLLQDYLILCIAQDSFQV